MLLCSPKCEMIFIRHSPTLYSDKLFGTTDVEADLKDSELHKSIKERLKNIDVFYSSPAKRCLQTFNSIWPKKKLFTLDKRLWEQDFGDWEGLPYSQIPNIGKLNDEALADYSIPKGESYNDMCKRIQPAIQEIAEKSLTKSCIIICHAGTVRAAIALALNCDFKALRFEINHLSLTRIRVLENRDFSIISTNINI